MRRRSILEYTWKRTDAYRCKTRKGPFPIVGERALFFSVAVYFMVVYVTMRTIAEPTIMPRSIPKTCMSIPPPPYPTQRRTSSAASIPRAEATFCQLESSAGLSLHI